MPGLGSVIVGYPRSDARTLHELWEVHGRRALPGGRCINCGVEVFFVESGRDAIRTRDPKIICQRCWDDPTVKADIYKEL